MMNTLLLVDRSATQAGAIRAHGPNASLSFAKLKALLAPDSEMVVWDHRPSDGLQRAVELSGGKLIGYDRDGSGEAENGMAVTALCAPDTVRKIIFVTGSKGITPVLQELALDDQLEIVVAGYRTSIALALARIPGITIVELDLFDVTR